MSEQKQVSGFIEPVASRPRMEGYGVPERDEGMLSWRHVTERLEESRNYWVGTAGADGRPHAVPVWGAWDGDALYFGGGPRTARNLAANPQVAVHLESGDDVVMLEGAVEVIANPDPSLSARLDDAFATKYDWRPSEEGGGAVGEGMYVLRPRVVFAWTRFPEDATRWRFGVGERHLVDGGQVAG